MLTKGHLCSAMRPLVDSGDLLIWDYYNNSRRRSTNFNNSSITQQRRPANWDFSNKYLRRSPGLNNASVSQQWRPDNWEFSNNCRQRSSSFNNAISQQLSFLTTTTKGRPVSTMQLVNSSSFVKKIVELEWNVFSTFLLVKASSCISTALIATIVTEM